MKHSIYGIYYARILRHSRICYLYLVFGIIYDSINSWTVRVGFSILCNWIVYCRWIHVLSLCLVQLYQTFLHENHVWNMVRRWTLYCVNFRISLHNFSYYVHSKTKKSISLVQPTVASRSLAFVAFFHLKCTWSSQKCKRFVEINTMETFLRAKWVHSAANLTITSGKDVCELRDCAVLCLWAT